jgi:hypothetical protein
VRRSLKLQDSSKMNERGDIIQWIGNRDYIVFAENKSIYGSRSCFGFLFCISLFCFVLCSLSDCDYNYNNIYIGLW